jgi:ABC-type multidrug transport system ATPase subunit
MTLEGIGISFGDAAILQDVTQGIDEYDRIGVIGINGTGKSTLLAIAAGALEPDAGRIIRRTGLKISYLPQNPVFDAERSVLENVVQNIEQDQEFWNVQGEAAAMLQKLGIEDPGVMPETLSGGQRKRLSIAMEFISNPALFILDEPDSGLDGVMARELMEQLRRIADQGKIVIVITHTPDRVIDLFDDVIVLAKDAARTGRLAFYGSIDDARAFFHKERMEQIVMSVNRTEEGGEGKADEYIMKYAEVQHG